MNNKSLSKEHIGGTRFKKMSRTSISAISKQNLFHKLASFPQIEVEKRQLYTKFFTREITHGNRTSILVVMPWMASGGADKVVLDLSAQLSKQFDIHFITTESDMDNVWHDQFAKVSNNIFHLPNIVINSVNKKYFIAQYCKQHGISHVLISNSLTGYFATPQIRKASHNTKVIDILHGEGGKEENGGFPKIMQQFERHFSCHVTVTEYLKEKLVKTYHNNADKIKVIHNGVYTDFFDPATLSHQKARKSLGIKEDVTVICLLGRLSVEKRPLLFLEVAKLLKRDPKLFFVIGGTGPMQTKVDQYIAQNGIAQNVKQFGEYKNAKALLATSDVLMMTSEMEGLPIVLLEAGSMGVPVIAPAVGGISEYVVDQGNGLLIEKDMEKAKSYVDALVHYLKNKDRFFTKEKIRSYTKNNFSITKMAQTYEKILTK